MFESFPLCFNNAIFHCAYSCSAATLRLTIINEAKESRNLCEPLQQLIHTDEKITSFFFFKDTLLQNVVTCNMWGKLLELVIFAMF